MTIIKSFSLDTRNIRQNGESRQFRVGGDPGSKFSLEVRNVTLQYYNFSSKQFQAAESKLRLAEIGNSDYTGVIKFPSGAVGTKGGDMYSIRLIAENGTNHDVYREVRNADGSVNVNLTTGSNSKILKRVIYKTLDTSLIVSAYSPSGLIQYTLLPAGGGDVIQTSVDNSSSDHAFELTLTVATTKSLTVRRNAVVDDLMIFRDGTVIKPVDVPGENIYPAVTKSHTESLATTVNGNVDNSTEVTTDSNASAIAVVDDRVTGNAFLNANVVKVISVSSGTGKTFVLSEPVEINDGTQLSFSARSNSRFEIDNVFGLKEGMRHIEFSTGVGVPIITQHLTQFTVQEGEINEYKIDNVRIPGVDTLGYKPVTTFVIDNNEQTFYQSTTQIGLVNYSKQFPSTAYTASSFKTFAYGLTSISDLSGTSLSVTNLNVSLSKTSTSISAFNVNTPTLITVASGQGVVANATTISGIGVKVDANGDDPIITAITDTDGSGFSGGAAIITVNTNQLLEPGIILTFNGSGRTAVITGNVKVYKAGPASEIIRWDIEKFLTMH